MAGRSYTPPTLCAHLRACREASLTEAGDSAIGGVSQHAPDHGAFPAASLTRRNAFAIELPRDLRDAKSLDCMHLKDAPHYAGLGFMDNGGGECLFRLAAITVAIRSAAPSGLPPPRVHGVACHDANAPGSVLVRIPPIMPWN
jgi:hypothetical protein